MSKKYLQIHPKDNVLAALTDLSKGTSIDHNGSEFTLTSDTQAKHKFTVERLNVGDEIIMYGTLVGKATKPIAQGETITMENVVHASMEYAVGNEKLSWEAPEVSQWKDRTFNGYHRADGSVGTANYWLIIPMVFCENRNVEVMKSALLKSLGYHTTTDFIVDTDSLVERYKNGASENEILDSDIIRTPEDIKQNRTFPNVDGIKFLTHEGGCGGFRLDSETLCNLFAGYITNSNVAGATILSLGCQNAEVKNLEKGIKERDPNFSKPLYILEQQKSESERHFIEEAVKKTFLGLIEANKIERQPAPLNHLVLGLECGGSDGFSGISANPTLGRVSDVLSALGGSPILSEFPELCGVEQELMDRCVDNEKADKFIRLMKAYEQSAIDAGSGFDMNPSPGNIKDGLITDAMKSAGAAKKGGTSPVADVKDYAEYVTEPGLNLLCTPGNDVESTTGLVGSGANVVLFTTGLGTPTGNPIAPVIKVSSNTKLATEMSDIIDFDTGAVIRGEKSIEQTGDELLNFIIEVASGCITAKADQLGQDDFIPWKRGVSL